MLNNDERFLLVGTRPQKDDPLAIGPHRHRARPYASAAVLLAILLGCFLCDLFIPFDPSYMDLKNCLVPPNGTFLFGTDPMGRDVFSMIWSGGRISLFLGIVATLISTCIGVVWGTVSGLAPRSVDALLMRIAEILMSIPGLLFVMLLQTVFGKANVLTLASAIGITSWMSIAKVVRTEIKQLRGNAYMLAAKCMGGGFLHNLFEHLAPNFFSSVMFMVVMNIRSAIVTESTLSFIGIGLPLEIVSWGSMLSLAEKSLFTGAWWNIVIPGVFLTVTLLCITNISNYLRSASNRHMRNL